MLSQKMIVLEFRIKIDSRINLTPTQPILYTHIRKRIKKCGGEHRFEKKINCSDYERALTVI